VAAKLKRPVNPTLPALIPADAPISNVASSTDATRLKFVAAWPPTVFDDDPRLLQSVEDLAVEEFLTELGGAETLAIASSHGLPVST